MILPVFIIVLMGGGILAWITSRKDHTLARWISLLAIAFNFVTTVVLWTEHSQLVQLSNSQWLTTFALPWIPEFGISFNLALDGLSLLMLLLTFLLGIFAILISWKEIQYRTGFFHFNLLWVLAGITGVFLTMDLFLFYFFWEVMLIPMYFLIAIWGHENRRYAAYKFFIFTQASGLLMFLAILGLYFVHGEATNIFTFDYFQLIGTTFSPGVERWLMLGFLMAFIVKLPVVPFHSWLPDAHSEAPTGGSVILAGLLLKTGAYGLIRFIIPLFPNAAHEIAPWAMLFGVIGILYGAILAFSQTDLKRLVAYTSVSHMGFVMLGVFSFNAWATQGTVMQMITHGISTGALFIIAGTIYERIHTRDIQQMSGFWKQMPFMGTIGLIFAMASLGLPGLGNFIAEFLILIGAWKATHTLAILAAIGLISGTVYSLRIVQKIFYGNDGSNRILNDLSLREKLILVPLAIIILWLGLYPQPVLNTIKPTLNAMETAQSTTPGLDDITINIKREGGNYE